MRVISNSLKNVRIDQSGEGEKPNTSDLIENQSETCEFK